MTDLELLKELVEAIKPLNVSSTPLRLLDTRLNRAMHAAEKRLHQAGLSE